MKFDVIVVGGGHAGIEASLAASRMGMKTLLVTMDKNTIGRMSCNPAIGGQAKGHLVREIDALGGEMAKLIDKTGIHFKMLNKSKGPAVWSPRAQADKYLYEKEAQRVCFEQENLSIKNGIVEELIYTANDVSGVMVNGEAISSNAVILTCGTFLNGKIHIGLNNYKSGRAGEPPAIGLTQGLIKKGFVTGRLKTGTPPRIHADSINWDKTEVQEGDNPAEPFSFSSNTIVNKQIDMYVTYTNELTHEFLKSALDESPMYTGAIDAVGPRYCPSIEDKVVRFAERNRHQIFLEPEGYNTKEVYVNGFSTSLPERAQVQAIKSIAGLENAKILKLGYAIEYDYFEPYQLKNTMETTLINNLYFAGQICGTSGYEEAAAQGFIAGTNAALKIQSKEAFVLSRSESYIGVLIDDLINKSTKEPYRMFTSSAEFRLLLRQDNADLRLMDYGHKLGLITDKQLEEMHGKKSTLEEAFKLLNEIKIKKEEYELIKTSDSSSIAHSESMYQLLKRPEVTINTFSNIDKAEKINAYSDNIKAHIEFEIKYAGYIKRQSDQVDKFIKNESKQIPKDFDYKKIKSLSNEAVEKLNKIKPVSFGQASRISGIRPADLNILLVNLEKSYLMK